MTSKMAISIAFLTLCLGPFRPASVQFGQFRAAFGESWGVGRDRGESVL